MAYEQLISVSTRQPGTYTSPFIAVGANDVGARYRAIMADNEILEPANTLFIIAEQSFDGGLNWEGLAVAGWEGGPENNRIRTEEGETEYRRPGIGFEYRAGDRPTHVRLTISIGNRMRVGAEREVY